MQVGIVYWPILYNQTDALSQLEQMWNDGFRLWTTDISPDCPRDSQNHDTLQACLDKADSLGMETLLRIPLINFSDYPVEYEQFLEDFAGRFDSVLVLNEANRFVEQQGSIGQVVNVFWNWISKLPANVPVVTSFSAAWVLSNFTGMSTFLSQIGNRLSAVSLSVYSQDVPEASLPLVFKLLEAFGKPVWVTEIGSVDVQWTVRQLEVLRKNGVEKAYVWCWQTFWGSLEYNVRNTEKETVLVNYLKGL